MPQTKRVHAQSKNVTDHDMPVCRVPSLNRNYVTTDVIADVTCASCALKLALNGETTFEHYERNRNIDVH